MALGNSGKWLCASVSLSVKQAQHGGGGYSWVRVSKALGTVSGTHICVIKGSWHYLVVCQGCSSQSVIIRNQAGYFKEKPSVISWPGEVQGKYTGCWKCILSPLKYKAKLEPITETVFIITIVILLILLLQQLPSLRPRPPMKHLLFANPRRAIT